MDVTEPMYPRLQRHSPTRSPAWRWERARSLVDTGRNFSSRRDDAVTGTAMRYLRDLRRCRRDSQVEMLTNSYPDVHQARHLHEQGGTTVVEVQARLLARQSLEEIARRTSVPVDVIEMYEALFFDVVGHLNARDWITTQAIGWWAFDSTACRDPATVLRAYAYHGGPMLLDVALPYLFGDRMDVQPEHDTTTPAGRLDRAMRLAILVETLPWSAKTDAKLVKLHAELLADARKAVSQRPIEAVVARNAAEVLENSAADALHRSTGRGQMAHCEGDNAAIRETA